MTNEEIILKSVQAHLTPAQRHEIAAAAYTPEQITHAVEHIPDGLDELAASQVHTFAWWKDNGKSVKRGEKALFTCPLWKYTDKPSNAQIKAAEAAGKEVQPAVHYYPTTSYMFSCLQVESNKPAPAGRFKSMDEIKAYNKMLAEQRRAARVSAAIKTAAEAIAQDVTTEARQTAQQAAARVVVAVEEHHELPELVEAPKPATKKPQRASWAPGTVQIIMHNNPNSVLELNLQQFFPAPLPKLRQIMKLVCADSANSERITAAIVATLKHTANEYGPKQELARKNLVFLGEVKQDESPVKISSKPEFFEALDNNGKQRRTFDGYRATYNGFTFFITKARYANGKPSKGWNIFEARSGMGYAWCSSKAKAAETIVKKFNPETLKNIDFDHLEALKKAAPLAPTITI